MLATDAVKCDILVQYQLDTVYRCYILAVFFCFIPLNVGNILYHMNSIDTIGVILLHFFIILFFDQQRKYELMSQKWIYFDLVGFGFTTHYGNIIQMY